MATPNTADLDTTTFEWRALELAWRSCRSGTVGVGALLISETGELLAEGNNAILTSGDVGPLSNTRVAHAEMNVFAQLPPHANTVNATLYTSLEPCPMCAGAITLHDLARVRVLARDALIHDLDAMGDRNDWVRCRWAPRDFSTDVRVERLATLFATYTILFWYGTEHSVIRALIAANPDLAAWVIAVAEEGKLTELAQAQASLAQVVTTLCP